MNARMHSSSAATAADVATDPNCGMQVSTGTPRRADHHGTRYYFCGDGCLAKFMADPEAVLAKARLREVEAGRLDPVCGTAVDPAQARSHVEHAGKCINFCGDGCRDQFTADPTHYLHDDAGAPEPARESAPDHAQADNAGYACPMHPEVRHKPVPARARSVGWPWHRRPRPRKP